MKLRSSGFISLDLFSSAIQLQSLMNKKTNLTSPSGSIHSHLAINICKSYQTIQHILKNLTKELLIKDNGIVSINITLLLDDFT